MEMCLSYAALKSEVEESLVHLVTDSLTALERDMKELMLDLLEPEHEILLKQLLPLRLYFPMQTDMMVLAMLYGSKSMALIKGGFPWIYEAPWTTLLFLPGWDDSSVQTEIALAREEGNAMLRQLFILNGEMTDPYHEQVNGLNKIDMTEWKRDEGQHMTDFLLPLAPRIESWDAAVIEGHGYVWKEKRNRWEWKVTGKDKE